MIKLKAPADAGGSISVEGIETKIVKGFVEVEEWVVKHLLPFGFTLHKAEEGPDTNIEDMGRRQLFDELKARGIAASATLTSDQLRDILSEAIAKANATPVPAAPTFVNQPVADQTGAAPAPAGENQPPAMPSKGADNAAGGAASSSTGNDAASQGGATEAAGTAGNEASGADGKQAGTESAAPAPGA